MAQDLTFTTKVSGQGHAGAEIRGVDLTQLVTEADFVAAIFLSLTGKKPTVAEKQFFNCLLTACMDHGIQPASMFVPRVIAAAGNSVTTAMATSILALGPKHGAAVTDAMEVLLNISEIPGDKHENCHNFVADARAHKKRLPGFGHPHYRDVDPRAAQLENIAQQLSLDSQYFALAHVIESELATQTGRQLVFNIDGALAAGLLTIGINPLAGNGIFAVARAAGSVAHIVEEIEQANGVRRLPSTSVSYQP